MENMGIAVVVDKRISTHTMYSRGMKGLCGFEMCNQRNTE